MIDCADSRVQSKWLNKGYKSFLIVTTLGGSPRSSALSVLVLLNMILSSRDPSFLKLLSPSPEAPNLIMGFKTMMIMILESIERTSSNQKYMESNDSLLCIPPTKVLMACMPTKITVDMICKCPCLLFARALFAKIVGKWICIQKSNQTIQFTDSVLKNHYN